MTKYFFVILRWTAIIVLSYKIWGFDKAALLVVILDTLLQGMKNNK